MKSQERHNLSNETYFNESIYLPLGQSVSIYTCPGGTANAGDARDVAKEMATEMESQKVRHDQY